MKRVTDISKFLIGVLAFLVLTSCVNNSQFSSLYKEVFSTTPKCGITDRSITFKNTTEGTLYLAGVTMSPGTNGAGHFTIQGFKIGDDDEIPADLSGGVSSMEIPAGAEYTLRVRYSPYEETGEGFHSALVDMAFKDPNPGIVQIELYGRSEGVVDCPEVEGGGAEGLSGPVDLTITYLIAATGGLGVPLTTDMGVDDFVEVTLSAEISGNDFIFPQITSADNFFLQAPDPSVEALAPIVSIVYGSTDITTESGVTGTFVAETGRLTLPNLKIFLEDEKSKLVLDMPFTTDTVDRMNVPMDRLQLGEFKMVGGKIAGLPVQEDGTVHLVGTTLVTEGTGPLSAAVGLDIAVRIEAIILCAGEDDTVCDGE